MVEAVERYPGRGTVGSTKRPVLVHYVLARHGGGGPELLHVTHGDYIAAKMRAREAAERGG